MSDLMSCISFLFTESWKFLTGLTIPGTNFHVASLFVWIAVVEIGFKLLGIVLGIGFESPRDSMQLYDQLHVDMGHQRSLPAYRQTDPARMLDDH